MVESYHMVDEIGQVLLDIVAIELGVEPSEAHAHMDRPLENMLIADGIAMGINIEFNIHLCDEEGDELRGGTIAQRRLSPNDLIPLVLSTLHRSRLGLTSKRSPSR